jgi:coenzyme Q-binding protein COQ10
MSGATRSITIDAPLEKTFQVISDYDRYAEFLPQVKKIHTANRSGDQVDVHYEVEVIKTIKYALRVKEEKPKKISWTFISGDFMKDNKGSWVLEDLGGGKTKATYSIEMAFGMLVPKTVVNTLAESQLPSMMEAFKKRAETVK